MGDIQNIKENGESRPAGGSLRAEYVDSFPKPATKPVRTAEMGGPRTGEQPGGNGSDTGDVSTAKSLLKEGKYEQAYGVMGKLLNDRKYEQALPLMLELRADAPSLNTVEFQKRLNEATTGGLEHDARRHYEKYVKVEDGLKDPDKPNRKEFEVRLTELKLTTQALEAERQQVTKGLKALEEERATLKRAFVLQPSLENQRLNREIVSIEQHINYINKGGRAMNKKGEEVEEPSLLSAIKTRTGDMAYLQGTLLAQRGATSFAQSGDLVEANNQFLLAKSNDTSFAKKPEADLDGRIRATSFWGRNYQLKEFIEMGTGLASGVVVGALVAPETFGVGGVAAGTVTATRMIGAAAIRASVARAAARAAASSSAFALAKSLVGDEVGVDTFVRGAGLGFGAGFGLTGKLAATGLKSGAAYGLASGGADFIADVALDHVPLDTAAMRLAANVAGNAIAAKAAGKFAPAGSRKAMPRMGSKSELVLQDLSSLPPKLTVPAAETAWSYVPSAETVRSYLPSAPSQ